MAMAHFRQRASNKNDGTVLGKSYKSVSDENRPLSTTTFGNRPVLGPTKGMNSTRTVLGTLSTNVDLKRDAISVKPKVISSKPSFTIFEDVVPDVLTSVECSTVLSEHETSKEQDENQYLPMRIDKTFEETLNISGSQHHDVPIQCYTQEIYQYMKETERKLRPKPHYMRKQPDITHSMRSILVDWLVEVAEEYNLNTETLYLSISYIDHFLSTMSVLRSKLQLVGTASMFIAAKYEEIYPPEVGEFVYITDNTYTKKQVLRMEQLILKVLSFDLAIPTAHYFLQCFCTWAKVSSEVKYLAEYLCELSLLHADPFLQYLPSEVACSALALASRTLDFEPWNSELSLRTGYDLNDFRDCFESLYSTFAEAATFPQQAIREKYSSTRYHGVARNTSQPVISS